MPGTPIRVFLLDDHDVVRRGLRTLLEEDADIVVIGEASAVSGTAARILDLRPDVAVLDGRLPDGSGVEVCREVRSMDPTIHVLILTSYDDDEALSAAVAGGAAGYVLKRVRGEDLTQIVRRVAAGHSVLDDEMRARARRRLERGPTGALGVRLSPQEARLLDLVVEGLTNRQIATRLHLAEKTVKNYMTSLLAKLGVTSRTQAAILAARRDPVQPS